MFLERASGGDAALLERAQSLLLELGAAEIGEKLGGGSPGLNLEAPGDRIGRYKLLQEIGEGGFGVVWMAEQQEPVTRKVALKILKLGLDTKHVVARFELERQALALMDHPNIAKVLDGGATEHGRPYFVMELVRGVPITRYCDDAGLDTRGRLELFREVCKAVQHAHHKGVIHRDIKPSNILVTLHDGRPVPKVIDFGIAKAISQRLTDKTLFTEFRQMIGTPEYMAPEQAAISGLDVDTRADVYSLGVLLYELLTGTKPFRIETLMERGYEEILRTIREVDPPRPSTRVSTLGEEGTKIAARRGTESAKLSRFVRGDLDWIVMKALEKDRVRRYDTANAFADDIDRFLQDLPVLATPPSRAYRLRKYARRHRVGVLAGAVVTLALLAGLVAATLGYLEASHQRDVARIEASRARTVIDFVSRMVSAADPHESKGEDYTVRELLDEFDHDLGETLADQPEVEADLRELIGRAYRNLGQADRAAPHLEKALELRRRTLGPAHHETLSSERSLGWLRHLQDRNAEADQILRGVVSALEANGDGDDDLARDARFCIADLLRHEGRYDEAETLIRRTLQEVEAGPDVDQSTLASGLQNLSFVLYDRGRLLESLEVSRRALELLRLDRDEHTAAFRGAVKQMTLVLATLQRHDEAKILALEHRDACVKFWGRDNEKTWWAERELAALEIELGDYEPARERLRTSLASCEHNGAAGSFDHQCLLFALANLAHAEGRTSEAEELYRRVLPPPSERSGQRIGLSIATLESLSALAFRGDEAEALAREARSLADSHYGTHDPRRVSVLVRLAKALRENGGFEEAETLTREALALDVEAYGPDSPFVAQRLASLGAVLARSGRFDEGFAHLERALSILEDRFDEHSPACAPVLNMLAGAFMDRRDARGALPLIERACEIMRADVRRDSPETRLYESNLAEVLCDVGRAEEGVRVLERVLARVELQEGPASIETARAHVRLASRAISVRPAQEARDHAQAALAILDADYRRPVELWMSARFTLGQALTRLDQPSEAVRILAPLAVEFDALLERHSAEVIGAHAQLGVALMDVGRLVEARVEIDEALVRVRERADPMDARLHDLIQRQFELATRSGDLAAAERAAREVVTLSRMARSEEPLRLVLDLVQLARLLAENRAEDPEIAQIEREAEAELVLHSDWAPSVQANPWHDLGGCAHRRGDFVAADERLCRAIELRRGARDWPTVMRLGRALAIRGRVLNRRGSHEEARRCLVEALPILERDRELPVGELPAAHAELGLALRRVGRPEEAVKHAQISVDAHDGSRGHDPRAALDSILALAQALEEAEEWDRSEATYTRFLEEWTASAGLSERLRGMALFRRARLRWRDERFDGALTDLRDCSVLLRALGPGQDLERTEVLDLRVKYARSLELFEEAAGAANELLPVLRRTKGPNAVHVRDLEDSLAQFEILLGRTKEACERMRAAIELRLEPDPASANSRVSAQVLLGWALVDIARVDDDLGAAREAVELLRSALDHRRRVMPGTWRVASAAVILAEALVHHVRLESTLSSETRDVLTDEALRLTLEGATAMTGLEDVPRQTLCLTLDRAARVLETLDARTGQPLAAADAARFRAERARHLNPAQARAAAQR